MNKKNLVRKVLLSIFAASVLGSCASAMADTHTTEWVVDGQTIENRVISTSDAYNAEDLSAGANITNSIFRNNQFTGSHQNGVYGGVFRIMNTVNPNQIVNVKDTVFDSNISKATQNQTWALGGAVMVKGATTTFENVDFDNNKIVGDNSIVQVGGGAVYVDAVKNSDVQKPEGNANVTFKVNKNMAYTGNTILSGDNGITWYDTYGGLAQSKGGFLFIDRDAAVAFDIDKNAVLTIGNVNSTDINEDTIASVLPHADKDIDFAVINKNGEGTLTINSSLNDYYGIVNINAGTLNVNKQWKIHNEVNLVKGNANLQNILLTQLPDKINAYDTNLTNQKEYNIKEAVAKVTTASGTTLTAKNIVVNAGGINAEGRVEANHIESISPKKTVTIELNGGGFVDGSKNYGSGVYLKGNANLTAKDVAFTGEVSADNGAEINITGGSVTASDYYERHNSENPKDWTVDGYTDFGTTGGTINATNVDIKSGISVSGSDGQYKGEVNINNSNITDADGLWAGKDGVLNLNGSADNLYAVQDYILVEAGGKININGGTLKADSLKELLSDVVEDGSTFTSVDKGIVLQNNGVIETKAGQIFANGDATGNDSGKVTNNQIDYQGGTLKLNDAEYTLGYAKTAGANMAGTDSGKTAVIMTGTLVGDIADDTVTVDDAASVGSNVALDRVTANADKNLLVGSTSVAENTNVEGISVVDQVANGFAVGKLNLAADSTGVVITNAKEVTLGGTAGGSVVTVNGAEPADKGVQIIVGTKGEVTGVDKDKQTGTLNIGNSLVGSDTELTVNGSVIVNKDSALNTRGQTTITTGITLDNASANAVNGKLTTDVINTSGNSAITGTVATKELKTEGIVNIGNTDKAGVLTAEETALNGATVYLDPAYKDGGEIADGSKAGFVFTNGVDGKLVVGENSTLTIGSTATSKAEAAFAETGLIWGSDVLAAAYITGSQSLASGSLLVSSDANAESGLENGKLELGKQALLMVDGASAVKEAALTGVTGVSVSDTAKLYIDGAKKGETYNVLAGTDVQNDNKWYADKDADTTNVISNSSLIKFVGAEGNSTGKFNVTAQLQKINDVYTEDKVVIADVIDKTLNDKNEGDAAYDFFMAAADSKVNGSKAAQASAINSAANIGELGGTSHGTYSMSNIMTDAVADHLSLATYGEQDKDVWAHYIHNKENVSGLALGGVDGNYDAQYNGIVVGSDLYKNGKATVGVALSYAEGNIDGSTLSARTSNDAEYYGASIYGRIDNGDSAVLGDISYLYSKNDIEQTNSGKTITATPKADAFSVGVKAEQVFNAGAAKFVPYAGLRYMHLGVGNYNDSLGLSYNSDEQNLWLLPVGVTYSQDIKAGSWTLRPVVEAGYVWTMGDRDTQQTVSLNGASDGFGFDVADSGSFISRFALEAENANVTYGLGYEYQKGDTVKANKWMANVNFSF